MLARQKTRTQHKKRTPPHLLDVLSRDGEVHAGHVGVDGVGEHLELVHEHIVQLLVRGVEHLSLIHI